MLSGSNFKEWKDQLLIVLGCLDLDMALDVEKPIIGYSMRRRALLPTSSEEEKTKMARWLRSNKMCLRVMQKTIPEAFRGPVSESTMAKAYLADIEQRFVRNEKAEIGILLKEFCSKKYSGQSNIREYILEMSHIASKLKDLKFDVSDDMLMYMILNSLPEKFGQFVMSYNCQKDKWTVNELISYCVQEEERLRKVSLEIANVATGSQNKGTKKHKEKAAVKDKDAKKQDNGKGKQLATGSGPVGKEVICFFCKGEGHYKKQCANYQQWLKKKGTLVSLVCSEVNTVSVPIDTWWIDSGATTHVSVSM